MPRIVSASRRTDMPGFHADRLARLLLGLRRPPDALFLWTKHPAAIAAPGPLRDVLSHLPNVLIHLTVTGLGAGPLEPHAPRWDVAVADARRAIGVLGGDPRRILWRYDPVVPGYSSVDAFERLADRFAALGVRRCISSFLSTMSLKGSLLPQYSAHGIAPCGIERKLEWSEMLAERARRRGIDWRLCCQPKVVERLGGAVSAASCIDAELASALHPEGLVFDSGRDLSQRRHCRCAPSVDVGSYADDRCSTGCVYCYSKAGGPGVPSDRLRNC